MAYSLRRPNTRTGTGPVTVYRATSKPNQPLLQSPIRWVRQQPAFGPLSENPNPEHAALLARVGSANIEKVWTELAYEAVRVDVAPDAPSRLDSLYAFADPRPESSTRRIHRYAGRRLGELVGRS